MTEVLRQSVTQGRAVLQRVRQGRITFRPNGAGYTFEAPTGFDKLFAGGLLTQLPAYLFQHGGEGTEGMRERIRSTPTTADCWRIPR